MPRSSRGRKILPRTAWRDALKLNLRKEGNSREAASRKRRRVILKSTIPIRGILPARDFRPAAKRNHPRAYRIRLSSEASEARRLTHDTGRVAIEVGIVKNTSRLPHGVERKANYGEKIARDRIAAMQDLPETSRSGADKFPASKPAPGD